jgi:predicted amino acid-binding ACT domain protein
MRAALVAAARPLTGAVPVAAARTALLRPQQQSTRSVLAAGVRCFSTTRSLWADASASKSDSALAADSPVRASSVVITAAGPDRPGIVSDLSAALQGANANVEESRMTILGNDFAILLRVTVPESQSARGITELLQSSFPEFVVSARSTTTHPIFTSPVSEE